MLRAPSPLELALAGLIGVFAVMILLLVLNQLLSALIRWSSRGASTGNGTKGKQT